MSTQGASSAASSAARAAALRAGVLAQVKAEASPTRSDVRKRTALVAAIAAIASGVLFVALGGMKLGDRPLVFVAHVALGWAALAAFATQAALRRGAAGLGLPRTVLVVAAVTAGPALAAFYMILHARELGGADVEVALRSHAVCFALTAVFGMGPFAIASVLRRGADPVHPRAFGAAVAAASAAWGGLIVTIHCPIAAEHHVIGAHALPVVVLSLCGAVLGARIFGLRSTR
jgi:hypothetical protein